MYGGLHGVTGFFADNIGRVERGNIFLYMNYEEADNPFQSLTLNHKIYPLSLS